MMAIMKLKAIILTATFIGLVNSTLLNAQIDPANNIIGVDIGMPENPGFNYDSCFALGANLGMGSIGLYQNWTAIETAPNTFNLTIFDIADFYYPLYNMPVDLTIAPIHTNNLEVPSDLVSVEFNNTTFIHRFKTLLDSVKAHIPNLTLNSLVIGSEHDVYMGSDSILWAQYTEFYDSVSTYAKTLWPGLMIATELTFGGITTYNTYAQILNTNSDYIGFHTIPCTMILLLNHHLQQSQLILQHLLVYTHQNPFAFINTVIRQVQFAIALMHCRQNSLFKHSQHGIPMQVM
jgi:hypothetical protein